MNESKVGKEVKYNVNSLIPPFRRKGIITREDETGVYIDGDKDGDKERGFLGIQRNEGEYSIIKPPNTKRRKKYLDN